MSARGAGKRIVPGQSGILKMGKVILIVLDSVGVGGAPDAKKFNDEGANTLAHVMQYREQKNEELKIPNLIALGIGEAVKMAGGEYPKGLEMSPKKILGAYGCATEISSGRDTPSGHWEITGVPVEKQWTTFPDTIPTFPNSMIKKIIEKSEVKDIEVKDILGNKHASGTKIIEELGQQHIKTGNPIFYTSADSVVQIAAHEDSFGIKRLYNLCEITFEITKKMNVQRVIARPFVDSSVRGETQFTRTKNRKDYCVEPPEKTLLDFVNDAGGEVYGVGKIFDIFAGRGVNHHCKAEGNVDIFKQTMTAMKMAKEGDLIFANFVDFDQLYGHRRDVEGYAKCLEQFDAMIPQIMSEMKENDMLVITADHGNDPTWEGSDHTREKVPVLIYGETIPKIKMENADSFCDIGATIAAFLKIPFGKYGKNLIKNIC